MSDTIEVKTVASFLAWEVPEKVFLTNGGDNDERLSIPVADAGTAVIDALAQRWLDNLYASRGERSPFRIERSTEA